MSVLNIALKTVWAGQPETPVVAAAPNAEQIRSWLIDRMAQVLDVHPADVDTHEPFANYGLGSLSAVRLAGDLEAWLHRDIPATLTWDYPTIDDVVRFLSQPQTKKSPSAR